jgi:hypothetical protein
MEFKKYDKIYTVGHTENQDIFKKKTDEINISEKMDGGNFRFYINKGGNIIFGSRTQQLTSNEGLDTNVEKNFRRCVDYVREKWEAVKDTSPNLSGYIIFGENMISHTMQYDWEKIPPFLGFDIYDIKTGKYLSYKVIKKMFKDLNLEMVPLIKICKAKDIKNITEKDIPKSKYVSLSSKDQLCEGLVYKNHKRQLMAKIVRKVFQERNREVFGNSKKFAKTDDEYFVAIYCTNARIDKCIFKLIDEGKDLAMTMMGDLVKMVYRDIWEENWDEISFSKKKIDLLNLKKLVSRRCLEILQQSMINNSLK